MLKLKFDPNQKFQQDAVESIADIFDGQPLRHSAFTATKGRGLFGIMTELGYGNKLDLIEEDLLKNVIRIQDRNKLKRSTRIVDEIYGVPNFAVEMETGTGKTYAYTRTIFELNQRYGFSKFIIVVPSVAIREGVKKSLEITESHFRELFPNQPFDYFVYDSTKLSQVRNYATANAIQIMIINIDAFRKSFEDEESDAKANVIHKKQEKLSWRRPIEFIQATNPIVLIDEPQSVDNTEKAKESIKSLNPLCILRYSATHRDAYNLMYKLGPVDAYDQKLVKKIEVLALGGESAGPSIKLVCVSEKVGTYTAKVEIKCVKSDGSTVPKTITINAGKKSDLFLLSGENPDYKGYRVTSVSCAPGNEHVEVNESILVKLQQATNDDGLKRAQIRSTIEAHLEKETLLLDKGIKVLSLFFIDRVANYRDYEAKDLKGAYARIFEEEYLKVVALPKYQTLFTTDFMRDYALTRNVDKAHDGYFSQDKKGKLKDTTEGRTTQDDQSIYDLIMKQKELLLSFDSPLRFIFSHSALREGWDNPNVFQICTLVETQDMMTKRQKIGRGLRLPVNQKGDRIMDDQINVLTVIANESYEQFAETLQREIESETNTRFGVITERHFEDILVGEKGETQKLGYDASKRIHDYLVQQKFLDRQDKATKELKEAVAKGEIPLPQEFMPLQAAIVDEIKNTMRQLPIFDKNTRERITVQKQVLLDPNFRELWDRIKWKTVFRLDFDVNGLIQDCIDSLKDREAMPELTPNPIIAKWVNINITKQGISASDPHRIRTFVRDSYESQNLPNLLEYIERFTRIKKETIAKILIGSGRLEECYVNPQVFMEKVVSIINRNKIKRITDGIRYELIGDGSYYAQERFLNEELLGYLRTNALPVTKSVFSHVLYDSNVERDFAESLNGDDDVKLFVKLPDWFKIETPLGTYNPDWAVVLEKNGEEMLYFVLETKGSILSEDLRFMEGKKIECGKKHFAAIDKGVGFEVVESYTQWRGRLMLRESDDVIKANVLKNFDGEILGDGM